MDNCLLCKSKRLVKEINLGEVYPSIFIDCPERIKEYEPVELAIEQCQDCQFVQLTKILPPDSMYRKYWYRSGLNNSMIKALEDVAINAVRKASSSLNNWALDIGSNDSTLLGILRRYGYSTVGFDPANNLAEYAKKNCDVFINNYFSNKTVHFGHKFGIITSIAMFYDLEEPRSFIQNIKENLADGGVWIIQMTDLTCMLYANAFDNICMEHLAYYTLKNLNKLLLEFDLTIFDVSYNDVNGRSIRVYVGHKKYNPDWLTSSRVEKALQLEQELLRSKPLKAFNKIIEDVGKVILNKINELNVDNKKVFALGASTKGNTLLQKFKITNKHIPLALEVNKDKHGLYTGGSNIRIVSEEEGFKLKPDYLLVLPWHFIDFFREKKKDFLEAGGKFIVPLPVPMIISKDKDEPLL